MKTLGIHLITSELRYAVLDGTKTAPRLIEKKRLTTLAPNNVPPLMDWFDTQFRTLIDQHNPDAIAYRLSLNANKAQLFTSVFPFGILNNLAHQKCIPIEEFTPKAFNGKRIGLPPKADLQAHCDSVFGQHPPYWDKNQKYAVLAAWFQLP